MGCGGGWSGLEKYLAELLASGCEEFWLWVGLDGGELWIGETGVEEYLDRIGV
jgi:hypothetical protein